MSRFAFCKSAEVKHSTVGVLSHTSEVRRVCSASICRNASSPGTNSQKSFLEDGNRPFLQHRHGQRQWVIAHSHGSHGRSEHRRGEDGLPSSLYVHFDKLPPEGRTIDLADEFCNPEERRCRTAIYVWERKCKACYGTGQVSSRSRRGSRISYNCLSCHGIGYVRRASSYKIPDPEWEEVLTIGREGGTEGKEEKDKK